MFYQNIFLRIFEFTLISDLNYSYYNAIQRREIATSYIPPRMVDNSTIRNRKGHCYHQAFLCRDT